MNSPAEVAKNYIAIGKAKTQQSAMKLLILGILAGAFIGLAGVGATTASVSVASASVGKFLGACVFPVGLAMVLLAGSELFTGNNLIIISGCKEATWAACSATGSCVHRKLYRSVLVALRVKHGLPLALRRAEAGLAAAFVKMLRLKTGLPSV
jgi:hypothetical protein